MRGGEVRQVAAECCAFLDASTDRDWSRRIPDMEWSVAQVVAHIAERLLWYATDLAAGPRELSTMDLTVRSDTAAADLIATVHTFAGVLADVVDGASPDQRGWHPAGLADSSGFAAMGCDEMLIHTADAGSGLGVRFRSPDGMARSVLHRLFPWSPDATDPWMTLLWANGRGDLPGLARKTRWRWHCAPLSEWDGSRPAGTG